jgi:hypothetical protein
MRGSATCFALSGVAIAGSRWEGLGLLNDVADRGHGRTGASGGWRIEIVLPDPGHRGGL